jgi:glucose/arabinose dehydrogenase
VTVAARDFTFTLSRRRVPVGRSRFVVTNRGAVRHDFVIAGKKTRVLKPGARAVLDVTFPRPGAYPFLCTVPGHARLGMKGTLAVGTAVALPPPPTAPPPPPPPPPPPSVALQLVEIGRFQRPTFVTAPPGDERRLFVVEQRGTIRVAVDGAVRTEPFLDISDRVKIESETGLLGLAFAPDYSASGRFYVYFTAREGNGDVHLEEFRVLPANPNLADPASARLVLRIVKPWENHNGGMIQFGPDGYLYVAVGDGDSGVLNPPGAFAQTLDDLLGNVLRIDPSRAGGQPYTVPSTNPFVGRADVRPEIWAFGLRNPWRFWVDQVTGDVYIGDVGEGQREEVDFLPAGRAGANFGWPCFEGTEPFARSATCPDAVAPIFEYGHAGDACSVTAGLVMRDARLPALAGSFLYSDLCGGALRSLRVVGGTVAAVSDLGVHVDQPTSFGEDGLGRAYVASLDGAVYRLDPN